MNLQFELLAPRMLKNIKNESLGEAGSRARPAAGAGAGLGESLPSDPPFDAEPSADPRSPAERKGGEGGGLRAKW